MSLMITDIPFLPNRWWQLPYYYTGCKVYDLLAGHQNISSSYLISRSKALEAFPMLKSAGLVGAVVYYDGMHNDARMNLALILTAIKHGAVVTNYTEVTSLQKDTAGKLVGAMIKDTTTGTEFLVRAKGIINATGPFTDAILALDNPSHKPIVQASSGVHVTFPNYYSPRNMGLLDPATSDGRVIFFLPWQGNTIAGTTDTKARVETDPKPHEEDIRWILEEVRRYLSPDIQVRRGDVLSAWSGLRPLVLNPNAQEGTEGLVRNHLITVSQSGLVTIAGGKWTTYRAMAEETVSRAVELFELNATWPCRTKEVQLVGSEGWAKNMFIGLIQRVGILVPHRTQEVLMTLFEQYGLETEVAQHLADNYGDRAWTVCEYMEATGERWPLYGNRLDSVYPCKLSSGIRSHIFHLPVIPRPQPSLRCRSPLRSPQRIRVNSSRFPRPPFTSHIPQCASCTRRPPQSRRNHGAGITLVGQAAAAGDLRHGKVYGEYGRSAWFSPEPGRSGGREHQMGVEPLGLELELARPTQGGCEEGATFPGAV